MSLESLIRSSVTDFVMTTRSYEQVPGIDSGDLHVHFAAVAAESDALVTLNTRHFSPGAVPYAVVDPDTNLMTIAKMCPPTVLRIAREEHAYWQSRRPQLGQVKSVSQALRDARCPRFALHIESVAPELPLSSS